MFESIGGLGLAAKIAAGTAVIALGLTGVGAAGALPGPAQQVYDDTVTSLAVVEEEVVEEEATPEPLPFCEPDEVPEGGTPEGETPEGEASEFEATEEVVVIDDDTTGGEVVECIEPIKLPVGSGEFSSWVVNGAQNPDKVGSEFGQQVSEQARELREEKAAERELNGTGGGNGGGNGHGHDDDETSDEPAPSSGKSDNNRGGRP